MSNAPQTQGSPEWLDYRRTRGGASEVAALFGDSPFLDGAKALYERKTGKTEAYVNDAMRHGIEHEDAAREALAEMHNTTFEPQVVEHPKNPRIIASLDGINPNGTTIAEIKCPPKGVESDVWQHVANHNAPPQHYWLQIQQQLACSNASQCVFAVYDANTKEILTCTVEPDAATHKDIVAAWEEFFLHLDAGIPPVDTRDRTDTEWHAAAQAYREAKANLEAAKSREAEAKAVLADLAGDESARGGGVSLTRYYVKGSVDYRKAVPPDIDLEQYRKEGRWQTRLTVDKD